MRDLPGEQMELRFLDLIVTVDTIYFFNKLNQRISRNSLEILKVFVLFSPCEHFFFFRAEKPTVSVSLDLRSKKIRRDCST